MFKPNRVGTPIIHQSQVTNSTADFTLQQATISNNNNPFNVVNATPVKDFGYTNLTWNGTEALNANNKCSLVQQISVVLPEGGDVRGLELNASLKFVGKASTLIIPVFFRLTAAESSLFGGQSSSYDQPTPFAPDFASYQDVAGTSAAWHFVTYKRPLIVRNDRSVLPGTYAHGFQIFSADGTAISLTGLQMVASVRQLNDQQGVGYADTLR